MGYMLLYVIQGSDSVSGPYIRRGAHPPPHRHRPRVPAKLTHNHATGFPRATVQGLSLLGRPLLWRPASCQWFDGKMSLMLHTSYTCKSLVNYNVDYFFFRQLRKTGRALLWGGVRKFSSILMCVYWRCTSRRTSGWIRETDIWHPAEDLYFKVSGNARY